MFIFRTTYRRLFRVINNSNFSYAKLNTLSNIKNKKILVIGLLPIIPTISAQSLGIKEEIKPNLNNNIEENKQTNYVGLPIDDEKTPWERVRAIFERDEYGKFSKELITILNSSYLAAMIGSMYGGIQSSRNAFVDFMERNQATIFDNHLDAKRKLQNHVTIHFAKGAFKWAWRMTAFTGGFTLVFFSLHAYRGSTSLLDYGTSGAIIGAILRLKLGPTGILIGGTVGGILGFFCGLVNQSLLSLFNVSYDDVLSAQWKFDRERAMLMEENLKLKFENSNQAPKAAIEMLKDRENQSKEL